MSRQDQPFDILDAWALRADERRLLLWCILCIGLGFLMLWGSTWTSGGQIGQADLLPFGLYAVAVLGLHLILVSVRFRGDTLMVVALAFLSGLGILAQYRLGSFQGTTGVAINLALYPIGFALMGLTVALFMRGRHRLLTGSGWGWMWALLSLGLLGALLVFGQRFRGGVYAAGLITPSEMLKVTIVLFLAAYIDRHAKSLARWGLGALLPPWRALWPLLAVWSILTALLVVQRDLGLLVILSTVLLVMLTVGTGRLVYLVQGLLACALAALAVLELMPHGARRVQAWLDPFQDPTGQGWQILQGLSGMYAGGLWGDGFGRGSPEYTPIAQSDFVYAVIGEELGFAGSAILVLFFVLLCARGLQIAARAQGGAGQLIAVGTIMVLATQTLLNIGGVTKSLPLTGLPLPFISHGGSSLLTGFIGLGLVLAVSDGQPPPRRRGPS